MPFLSLLPAVAYTVDFIQNPSCLLIFFGNGGVWRVAELYVRNRYDKRKFVSIPG